MMYDFNRIEQKWQKIWDEQDIFAISDDHTKPKYYALVEFPYPSGQGLHVGHPRSYTALDIVARKRRLEGYNVLYPMGWDAFGLPTENFAMKNHIHPEIVTKNNVANFKKQLKSLGISFTWDREINTTNPEYYKWTQWIFLKLFEKGLAYKREMPVNWCTSCKVVLANEEVVSGGCERCGSEVIRQVKRQWMLKITEYAERLIDELDEVNYIERVKTSQINWIGKSEGAQIRFNTSTKSDILVYTTRPDTIFGATYLVVSPEHPFISENSDIINNIDQVITYQEKSSKKSDFERGEMAKDKTGVKLEGIWAINPMTKKEIPIYVSDYVLMSYGTGSIMAVPAHDQRDYEFAKMFKIPILQVLSSSDNESLPFIGDTNSTLINSDFLNGLSTIQAKEMVIKIIEQNNIGEVKVNFKLRDWVFSRQRYWGEPIPIVYCEDCGYVPISESELPLMLPEIELFEPTDDGESPLSRVESFVNTHCPKCGKNAKRETDTMPQWAGSSWYFLRYCDNKNNNEIASKEAINYWLPVDWYNGGMEHTTLHLLYSRFWHKFLYDIGVVDCKEPYLKRTSHGMILGDNGEKMSKARGNVVNPDDIVREYGADTLRIYEMFIGDFEKSAPWSQISIKGSKRFLDRVWNLQNLLVGGNKYSDELEISFNKTIKKVSQDIEELKFNTAIAAMMSLLNEIYDNGKINYKEYETFLIMLNPFAPHITEEIYVNLGFKDMIAIQDWITFDEDKCKDSIVEIVVQINGKVKTKMIIESNCSKENAIKLAKENDKILELLDGLTILKEIFVPNKLLNFVVK